MPRHALNYIDDCLALFFTPNHFEWEIKEAANVLGANLERFQSFDVAFAEQLAYTGKIIFESGRRVVSVFDVALCHALDDLGKGLGDVKASRRDRGYSLADDVLHDIESGVAVKGRMPAEHCVEEYAKAVDIGSRIRLSGHATRLLGRYEGQL